jgi:hypothetical protein
MNINEQIMWTKVAQDLYETASKHIHNYPYENVVLDANIYLQEEAKLLTAICKSLPVKLTTLE